MASVRIAVGVLCLYLATLTDWLTTDYDTYDIELHSANVYIISRLFDDHDARLIRKTLDANKAYFVRKHLPMRSAGALSLRELRGTPVTQLFRDHRTLHRIQNATGMQLQLVPRSDRNQVNALLYSKVGDGIDAHTDGNVYFGSRWAGIYVVRDDDNAPLLLDGQPVTLNANDFALFRADIITHAVQRRTEIGERLVVNTLLCDVCTPRRDPLSVLYQCVIDRFVFY